MPQPDRIATLQQVGRLSTVIAGTLVKATRTAAAFFSEGKPFSANLFADLTRYEARLLLRAEQLETADDDDLAIETQMLANIGLQLYANGFLFKILKFGPNQSVPVPATNARVAFYNQQLSTVPDPRTNTLRPVALNLLYLWDSNEAREASRLILLCPATSGKTSDSITWHWFEEIELPALVEDKTRESVELSDLDISLPRVATERDDLEIGRVDEEMGNESEDEDDSKSGTN